MPEGRPLALQVLFSQALEMKPSRKPQALDRMAAHRIALLWPRMPWPCKPWPRKPWLLMPGTRMTSSPGLASLAPACLGLNLDLHALVTQTLALQAVVPHACSQALAPQALRAFGPHASAPPATSKAKPCTHNAVLNYTRFCVRTARGSVW